MKFFAKLLPFILVLVLSACSAPAAPTAALVPTQPGVPPTSIPPAATANPAALFAQQLQNGTYQTPQYHKKVILQGGKYEAGSGADYLMVALLPQMGQGDLNGDGQSDAVVLLAENSGGSGVFVSLVAVLNQNGQPVQSGAILIDDRPKIESLWIENGLIKLNATIHGPNDPMASPTLIVSETYQLVQNQLTLVSLASHVAGGAMRLIYLESPAAGSQASGSLDVKGNMPTPPFENNLTYRILDMQGKKLAEGPFAVTPGGLGETVSFNNKIDISAIPSGTPIRFELLDLSAADGSTQAMSSVLLTVQ